MLSINVLCSPTTKDNYSEENKYKKKIVKYLKKHDVILIFDDFDRIDNESKNDLFHHLSEVNLCPAHYK